MMGVPLPTGRGSSGVPLPHVGGDGGGSPSPHAGGGGGLPCATVGQGSSPSTLGTGGVLLPRRQAGMGLPFPTPRSGRGHPCPWPRSVIPRSHPPAAMAPAGPYVPFWGLIFIVSIDASDASINPSPSRGTWECFSFRSRHPLKVPHHHPQKN